ncbi:MAG: FMN-binding protein [Actinomycetota bacterium]|nr:FMN-binding protein [Actinomycetota bacterium]
MTKHSNSTVITAAGLSAVMASLSGTALALLGPGAGAVAFAAAADGQDINNDWGQTPEEVAAEISAQVAADPGVVAARATYRKALHVVDVRRSAVRSAQRDYLRAQKTKQHRDDRRTKRALVDARRALAKALTAAQGAKAALDEARRLATEQITAQHYVLEPTPTPTDTVTPTPTDTVTATPTPTPTPTVTPINGTFLGLANDANPYGTMQVQIVVTNSVITAVTTPVYPNTGDSKDINAKALPKLQQEAIVAQSSKIASVSGATYSSNAFKQSLQSAIVLAGLPG